MAEIRENKAIEDAAVQWVLSLERSAGRNSIDTRYIAQAPGDLDSPPRTIEIKAFGTSSRGSDLWMEVAQVEEARRNPNFYIYIVENVRQGDPSKFTIKVLGGELLAQLLAKAKERRYYSVPLPVKVYASAPNSLEPNALGTPSIQDETPMSASSDIKTSTSDMFTNNYERLDEAARQLGSPPKVIHLGEIIDAALSLFYESLAKSSHSSFSAAMDYQTINVRSRAHRKGDFSSPDRWNRSPAFVKVGPGFYRRLSQKEREAFQKLWEEGFSTLREVSFSVDKWEQLSAMK